MSSLLPPRLRFALNARVLLVPPHYDATRGRALLALLERGTHFAAGSVWLEGHAIAAALRLGIRAPESLAYVHWSAGLESLDEALALLEPMGAALLLLRHPERRSESYAWLDSLVKTQLTEAVQRHLQSAVHPLRCFGVEALPVHEAAARTEDPVELLALLESALEHRTRNGLAGQEAAWRQSLDVATQERFRRLALGLGEGARELATNSADAEVRERLFELDRLAAQLDERHPALAPQREELLLALASRPSSPHPVDTAGALAPVELLLAMIAALALAQTDRARHLAAALEHECAARFPLLASVARALAQPAE